MIAGDSPKKIFIGIDIGSVSVNIAVIDENYEVLSKKYIRTSGEPIGAVKSGLLAQRELVASGCRITGVGTTGSGRQLIGHLIGADEIKNEITAHAAAAIHYYPDVSTVLEIGGQDSKIIVIRDRVVVDFAMNTICAAGTGSFLDQQAARLGIDISEFGRWASISSNPTKIAGRCGVFAESDMIHKQQMGYRKEDIIAGLCYSLVYNYMNNVGRGKKVEDRVVFQGGVAANSGIIRAFTDVLGRPVTIPPHHDVMGAIGVAIIAAKNSRKYGHDSKFKGFDNIEGNVSSSIFECAGCANRCEIVSVKKDDRKAFNLGGRCGKFDYAGGEGQG